jgi:hypothetical protein
VGNLRSVLGEQIHNPTRVALRVFAEQPPGYLRGRVFDTYLDGEWHLGQRRNQRRRDRSRPERVVEPSLKLPQGLSPPSDGQRLFTLATAARGPYHRLEIWNDPERGNVFFLPINAAHLVAQGEYLALDDHDVVHAGISTQAPYLAYAGSSTLNSQLTARDRAALTAVPFNLDPRIVNLAKQIGAKAKIEDATRWQQSHASFSNVFVIRLRGSPSHLELIPSRISCLSNLQPIANILPPRRSSSFA